MQEALEKQYQTLLKQQTAKLNKSFGKEEDTDSFTTEVSKPTFKYDSRSVGSMIGKKVSQQSNEKERPEPFSKDEQRWNIKGEMMTEQDIAELIIRSSYSAQFKIANFFRFFLYHLMFFFLSPPIGNLLIWIIEGFNTNLLFNLQFMSLTPGGIL